MKKIVSGVGVKADPQKSARANGKLNGKPNDKLNGKSNGKPIFINVNRKFNNEFSLSDKLFHLFQRQLAERSEIS